MITLNSEELNVMRGICPDSADRLESFVSGIKDRLYKGRNCTIWAEDETVLTAYNSLNKVYILKDRQLVSQEQMLSEIFDIQSANMGIKNIIVDNMFEVSDNWIYSDSGLWIMTANYFFTMLYVAFQSRGFSTEQLEDFAKEYGFSFDIQEISDEKLGGK